MHGQPARSTDLSPLEIFIWGYLKNIVYATTCEGQELLVRKAIQTITSQQLPSATENTAKRGGKGLVVDGLQMEQLL